VPRVAGLATESVIKEIREADNHPGFIGILREV
jgi:hypothetical protein